MPEPEWKGPLTKLDEVTLVHARILERLERKYDDAIQRHDEAIQRHDEEISRLHSALEKLISSGQRTNEAVEQLSANVQVLSAGLSAVLERMDRFIKGQESNGHKPGGKKK